MFLTKIFYKGENNQDILIAVPSSKESTAVCIRVIPYS